MEQGWSHSAVMMTISKEAVNPYMVEVVAPLAIRREESCNGAQSGHPLPDHCLRPCKRKERDHKVKRDPALGSGEQNRVDQENIGNFRKVIAFKVDQSRGLCVVDATIAMMKTDKADDDGRPHAGEEPVLMHCDRSQGGHGGHGGDGVSDNYGKC